MTTLAKDEGYYYSTASNGWCRKIFSDKVEAVRAAHAGGEWVNGGNEYGHVFLPPPRPAGRYTTNVGTALEGSLCTSECFSQEQPTVLLISHLVELCHLSPTPKCALTFIGLHLTTTSRPRYYNCAIRCLKALAGDKHAPCKGSCKGSCKCLCRCFTNSSATDTIEWGEVTLPPPCVLCSRSS